MKMRIRLLICSLLILSLLGCANPESSLHKPIETPTVNIKNDYSPKMIDNPVIYENDQADSIRVLYLTITPNNLTNDPPNTWDKLNSVLLKTDNFNLQRQLKEEKLDVIFQEGTESGPQQGMFGFGREVPNGVLTLRGQSALGVEQKSYKIKLLEDAGNWNGQQTINLMKHQKDLTRIRNKLSFDYFKLMPDITSLRTQFVHLYVKDLTQNPPSNQFEDYGLFTQIEQYNKQTLKTHGLDSSGQLYKAIFFEFFRYPDQLKLKSDPEYSKEKFESILEIKGNEDHTKLLKMLDDVNNYDLNIDEVFDHYFDRDNYFTWLAATILFNNNDSNSSNFYLYSPLNSEKWYFLPWDYDKGWEMEPEQGWDLPSQRGKHGINWEYGLSNYWGMVLPNRLFRNPENVEQLSQKVRELLEIIRPEQTKAFIDQYTKVVTPFTSKTPDIGHLPGTLKQNEEMLNRYLYLPDIVAENYFAGLENPMPFFLGEVREEQQKLVFEWDYSYSIQGRDLTYHFQIAKDPYFTNMITDVDGIKVNYYHLDRLEQGKYYWRVIAQDHEGHMMGAFDDYANDEHIHFRGVREFFVQPSGSTQ